MKKSMLLMPRPVVNLVIMQLAVCLVISLALTGWHQLWGIASVCGGLAVWLPNTLFLLLTARGKIAAVMLPPDSTKKTASGDRDEEKLIPRIAWKLASGEAVKMLVSFALLILALVKLHMAFAPLLAGWSSVLVVQLLAPVLISRC